MQQRFGFLEYQHETELALQGMLKTKEKFAEPDECDENRPDSCYVEHQGTVSPL